VPFGRLFGWLRKKEESVEPNTSTGIIKAPTLFDEEEEVEFPYKEYLEDHSMSEVFLDEPIEKFFGVKFLEFEADENIPYRFLLTVGIDRETGLHKVVIGGANWFPFHDSVIDLDLLRRTKFTRDSFNAAIRALVLFIYYDHYPDLIKRAFNAPYYLHERFQELKEDAKKVQISYFDLAEEYSIRRLYPFERRSFEFDEITFKLKDRMVVVPDSIPVRAAELIADGPKPLAEFFGTMFEDCMNILKSEGWPANDPHLIAFSLEYSVFLTTLLTDLRVTGFLRDTFNFLLLLSPLPKLDVKDLVENGESSTLNRHIQDSSWSKFLSLLAYKAERAGRRVERVKPTNTSKRCSNCGYVVENISPKDRWFTCPKCGWEADRDYNASLNILDVGLGRSRMPVEGEPLPLMIPYRKVIEGQVLLVKREAPCVSEG